MRPQARAVLFLLTVIGTGNLAFVFLLSVHVPTFDGAGQSAPLSAGEPAAEQPELLTIELRLPDLLSKISLRRASFCINVTI